MPILADWPAAGLTPLWKQPVGGGYASFVVARGRAFTIEQRGGQEVVAAYDVPTGRELWTNSWPAEFRESMGGDGPRATPTWSDGRVYALGATGELRALDDSTGKTLWRTNILSDSDARNLDWGMSAAPLVVDDTVIVLPGGSDGRSIVGYDRVTGKRAWSALGDKQAYCSPMLVTLNGVRQLLVVSATRMMGIVPGDGKVLWEYPLPTFNGINAAQPLVVGDNRVFVSASYGAGAAMIELSGSGDRFAVREVWRNTRMKNRFSGSVLRDGVIYGLDEGILAAIDAETGELKWKGGRYGYGQVAARRQPSDRPDRGRRSCARPGRFPIGIRRLPAFRCSRARPGTCRRSREATCSCAIWQRWRHSICGSANEHRTPSLHLHPDCGSC